MTHKIFFIFLSAFFFEIVSAAEGQTRYPQKDTLVAETVQPNDVVTSDKMNKGLVTTSLEALNGQAAGVSISRSNSSDMLNAVRVRGTTSLTGGNDPLVIIDGVSSDLSMLNTIYPGDIESFTILKDAAETARYGSRGASGVIVVNTKKHAAGGFHILYDGNFGIESVYKSLDMMSASQYRTVCNQFGLSFPDKGYSSDFQKAITRTGNVQNHHLAFGGGSETSSYRASIGVMDHDMVVKENGFSNYNAKLDISQSAFDGFLDVDLGFFGSVQKNALIHDVQKLFYSAAAFNPTYPTARNSSGTYDQISAASQINNPLSLLDKKDDENNSNVSGHISLKFHPLSWLDITATGSYANSSSELSQYFPTTVWNQGQAYRGHDRKEVLIGNIAADAVRTFGGHTFTATLLTEAEKDVMKGFHTTVNNFTTNDFGYDRLSAGAVRLWEGTDSYKEDPRLLSFMAALSWKWRTFSASGSLRADASSKFGENNKWGYFPSVSGAWNIGEEDFFRSLGWIDRLSLTAGYGLAGNQDAIGSYNSRQLVAPNGVVAAEGTQRVTLGLVRNANPDLKWEVRATTNVGLEGGFLGGRISAAADWYYSKTTDMLYEYTVSVPPFAYNTLMANLGSMSNQGFEIGLGAILVERKDFELNVNCNLSFQKNKLISLSGDYHGEYLEGPERKAISSLNGAGFHGGYNDIVYQIVGEPLGVFYLPHCKGLVRNSDGTYSYDIEDLNGGGVDISDGQDRYVAGQAMPKAILGSNISMRWKDLDLSVQLNGAFGHKIYNATSLTYMNVQSLPYYNVLSKAPSKNISDQTATDWWLEDGDYVNIDYVTLGWSIPIPRAKYLKSLRLSLSVNNLATITGYSGLSPMINSSVLSGTLGVDDKNTYPVYRSYTLGFSVQF